MLAALHARARLASVGVIAQLRVQSFSAPADSHRARAIGLYRQLLRAAKGFTNYNFREYAQRIVREDFRSQLKLADAAEVEKAHLRGQEQLQMLRRQATISQLYPQGKHAMDA